MRILSFFCVVLLTLSCRQSIENPTDAFLPRTQLAKLSAKEMTEISGIGASRANPGYLWGHNDSGNDAEVFLFDKNLKIVLTCKLKGVENRDWEDMTVGPGPEPDKNYVYVGDIGDNRAVHRWKYIYRFEEPVFTGDSDELLITEFDTLVFELSDQKKDSETLLIDPATKNLYVFSKREEPVWLYELKTPLFKGDTLTANKVMSLPFTQIVGGDISPDGKKILLKNYEHIYYWDNPKGKSIVDVLAETPFEVPYETEPQGEAITWEKNDGGFFTLSEKTIGKDAYLYFYPPR